MSMRKYKNKTLPRGIWIDRGYVFIRIFVNGRRFLKGVGAVSQPGVLDDAVSKLHQYRDQIRLGKFGLDEKVQRLMIEQAAKVYWELHASKKRSAKSYEFFLRNITSFFAGRYIDTLTYVDVQNFRREREKHLAPSSVNKEHAVLTNLFNKLKEWKRLNVIRPVRLPEDNPGSLVHKANEKAYARKRVLTVEEFGRLMESATIPVRKICLAAIHTTLRLKDLKLLTRDNVNEATNQLEGIQAKTGKPYVVPINGVMRQLIDSAQERHIFDFMNFRKDFEAARAQAGLRDFQFRDLRRTGARMMLRKGVDIAAVSRYLGHASINMTENYVNPTQDDMQVAGNILGSMYRWDPQPPVRTDVKTDVRDFQDSQIPASKTENLRR